MTDLNGCSEEYDFIDLNLNFANSKSVSPISPPSRFEHYITSAKVLSKLSQGIHVCYIMGNRCLK